LCCLNHNYLLNLQEAIILICKFLIEINKFFFKNCRAD